MSALGVFPVPSNKNIYITITPKDRDADDGKLDRVGKLNLSVWSPQSGGGMAGKGDECNVVCRF